MRFLSIFIRGGERLSKREYLMGTSSGGQGGRKEWL